MRPRVVPEGAKWCPYCDKVKPRAAFGINRSKRCGLATYCKPCTRATDAAWRRSEAGRACYQRRQADPARKAKQVARGRAYWRSAPGRRKRAAYLATLRGRLVDRLKNERWKSRHEPTPKRRASAARRLRLVERELRRLGWVPRAEKRVG